MASVRIKLVGDDIKNINKFVDEVKDITEQLGVSLRGPIPMPTKVLKITTRKSPDGEGKGSFDKFQMRIHKRLMDIEVNDRVIRKIMKVQIPKGVKIELKMIE